MSRPWMSILRVFLLLYTNVYEKKIFKGIPINIFIVPMTDLELEFAHHSRYHPQVVS